MNEQTRLAEAALGKLNKMRELVFRSKLAIVMICATNP